MNFSIGNDWDNLFDTTKLSIAFSKIKQESKLHIICPSFSDTFNAFKLCSLSSVKVVILGQDPYPQLGTATGLAFGNHKETDEDNLSQSLKIIKEAVINYEVPHNCITFDHTLESWAKQGVLLLNTSLTCNAGVSNSHVMIWRPFITNLISKISESDTGIVFILLGKQAQTFIPYISKRFNYILTCEHPAYFARSNSKMPNTVFTEANKILKLIYGTEIKWYHEY